MMIIIGKHFLWELQPGFDLQTWQPTLSKAHGWPTQAYIQKTNPPLMMAAQACTNHAPYNGGRHQCFNVYNS